jgi:hypothetical protein
MNTRKILIVTGLTLTALLIIQLLKKKKMEKRLTLVADEGYETAEDILFPKRKYLFRS